MDGIHDALPRGFAYVRVSSATQGEKYSLDTQLEGIQAYCRQHGIEIVDVFREMHTGVELWERPGLTRMRERVRNGEVDCVVVYTIDRLSRDPVHLGVVMGEAKHHGVAVRYVNDEVDDTPEGQLIAFVRGFSAKIEHAQLRERTMRSKLKMMSEGKLLKQGTIPYGYDAVEHDGEWHLIPNEAADAVRQIFLWALAGWSQTRIAKELNRLGVPSPAQARGLTYKDGRIPNWTQPTVGNILTNPVYAGAYYNRMWQVTKVNGKRKQARRPQGEWQPIKDGRVTPLVSTADWSVVQEKARGNGSAKTRNDKPGALQYLVRGRVTCAVCGGTMYSDLNNVTKYGRTDKARIYRCGSRKRGRVGVSEACGAKLINAPLMEAWVKEQVTAILTDEELLREQLQARQQHGPDKQLQKERGSLDERINGLDRKIERLRRDLRDEEDERFRLMLKEDIKDLLGQRDALTERLRQLDEQVENERAVLDQLEHFMAVLRNLRATIQEDQTFDEWRETIEALDVRVTGQGREWRMTATLLDGSGLSRDNSKGLAHRSLGRGWYLSRRLY